MINRKLQEKLELFHKDKEIIAVIGPRQVGKTTLITHYLKQFETKNKVVKLNFENKDILELFNEDINSFIEKYVINIDILFIDEVQYAKSSGQKLKFIYDTYPIKIYISGSSATDLSLNSIKYLVGRIFIFNLYPLSFHEFLQAKDKKLYSIYVKNNYKNSILKELNTHLKEYCTYGGYPRVVLEKNIEKKREILENIYNTYLLKEINEILQYSKDFKLKKLTKALGLQIGNLITYEELKEISEYSYEELKEALSILEKTFVCSYITPFFTNKRIELVKNPKIYFIDLGLRNHITKSFELDNLPNLGSIYENVIYIELIKNSYDVQFWRNKAKSEVDFIYENNLKQIPIEIKTTINSTVLSRSFHSFIEKYKAEKAYICNLEFENERQINSTKIQFLPFVKFIRLLNKKELD